MWWRRREFFEELDRMREEINRMFEDLFGRTRRAAEHVSPFLEKPLVDIYETDDEVVVVADLPGIEKDDISINAMEDPLKLALKQRKRKKSKSLDISVRSEDTSAYTEGCTYLQRLTQKRPSQHIETGF